MSIDLKNDDAMHLYDRKIEPSSGIRKRESTMIFPIDYADLYSEYPIDLNPLDIILDNVRDLRAGENLIYRDEEGHIFEFKKDDEYDPEYVDENGDKGWENNIVCIYFFADRNAYGSHICTGCSGDIHVSDLGRHMHKDGLLDIQDIEGPYTFGEMLNKNRTEDMDRE